VAGGCGGSGCSGETPRERETRNGEGSLAWWLHWPEVVAGGRSWLTVVGGCRGSGCSGERESARQRE